MQFDVHRILNGSASMSAVWSVKKRNALFGLEHGQSQNAAKAIVVYSVFDWEWNQEQQIKEIHKHAHSLCECVVFVHPFIHIHSFCAKWEKRKSERQSERERTIYCLLLRMCQAKIGKLI